MFCVILQEPDLIFDDIDADFDSDYYGRIKIEFYFIILS